MISCTILSGTVAPICDKCKTISGIWHCTSYCHFRVSLTIPNGSTGKIKSKKNV
ncbi:hypothetical protein F383_22522 [Gossypium arboreum]|uniref:Uncharacterized protein n=1 Tax=Gossypium arboreum TaxID=29729 RepID=A0A0B0P0C8_GOSAR|nr:hypothetical protein F383_22522 [Gossypium arboreum]